MPAPAPRNRLLASLAPADLARWIPQLTRVELSAGQVLLEPGVASDAVFFPETALVSLQQLRGGGLPAEVALVGRDGLVGLTLAMPDHAPPCRAVVRSAGMAWRLGVRELREELARGLAVLHLMLRYTQAMTVQIAQTALCGRHHGPDQQLCRWLLVGLDRIDGHTLEFSGALALADQGAGLQAALARLQASGAIDHQPGQIAVVRRDLLEQQACECHRIIQLESNRLLG